MGKNVFIVKTALQLINALEARVHFDIARHDASLFIVETKETDINIKQMSILLESQEWPDVHVVGYKPKYRVGSSARGLLNKLREIANARYFTSELNRSASPFAHADRVFIGNYNDSYLVHLANKIKPKSVYLLDDGLLTLTINEKRKEAFSKSGKQRLEELLPNAKKFLVRRYLTGIDKAPPKKVTFFTSYELDVGETDGVIVNQYRYLKSRARELADARPASTVYFLGMPWEATFKNENLYLHCVRQARDYFMETNFIYIPHRREAEETSSRVAKELCVGVERYSLPIEYQMIMSKRLPKAVASFTSTGLVNCSQLFDGLVEAVSFKIPLEYVKAERLARVKRAYEYYSEKRLGITSIECREELGQP